jgi:hypothetical protein
MTQISDVTNEANRDEDEHDDDNDGDTHDVTRRLLSFLSHLPPFVALQVALERQILKPVFSLDRL